MRSLHSLAGTHASSDDPNLVSRAGLVPVMALAQRAGLTELVAGAGPARRSVRGQRAGEVGCLVAGMIGGADSIDDMDLLRHGAMDVLFGGSAHRPRWVAAALNIPGGTYAAGGGEPPAARGTGPPGAAAARQGCAGVRGLRLMQKRVYGHKKQGARSGQTKIQGKSLLVRG